MVLYILRQAPPPYFQEQDLFLVDLLMVALLPLFWENLFFPLSCAVIFGFKDPKRTNFSTCWVWEFTHPLGNIQHEWKCYYYFWRSRRNMVESKTSQTNSKQRLRRKIMMKFENFSYNPSWSMIIPWGTVTYKKTNCTIFFATNETSLGKELKRPYGEWRHSTQARHKPN